MTHVHVQVAQASHSGTLLSYFGVKTVNIKEIGLNLSHKAHCMSLMRYTNAVGHVSNCC